MARKKIRSSLKVKTMSLSLGMMFLMVFVAGAMVIALNGKLQELALGNMSTAAQGLSAAAAAQFKQRYIDIQAFASNSALLLADEAAIADALNEYVKLYEVYDLIALYNVEGDLVGSNTLSGDGKKIPEMIKLKLANQKEMPWFKEALAQVYSDQKEHGLFGTYVEDFQLDAVSTIAYGTPLYGTSFSRAIKNTEGDITGVLTARANFRFVEKEFQNYYNTMSTLGLKDIEMTMINRQGFVILDYDPVVHLSTDVTHNEEVLLKLNLVKNGDSAAKDVQQGNSSSRVVYSQRKGYEQFTGYSSMKNHYGFLSQLGWGVMVRAHEDTILGNVKRSIQPFYGIALLATLLGAVVGFWISTKTSSQLVAVSGRLKQGAIATSSTSSNLQKCATVLASCTTEQAAAVNQTVEAMNEMNSMISDSAQYIDESLLSARRVAERSGEAAQIMRRLVASMESIQEANTQFQKMSNIINEISEKTNVINDIVFKTQLLSFNASIEAARSGQHGRGFAVVAEEVGILAQTSGRAAKEIKSLLEDSKIQVTGMIEITNSRSADGEEVSRQAKKTFDEIDVEIKSISHQIERISEASREQENGVKQTTVSMENLDKLTSRTAQIGEQVSYSAEELSVQSQSMNQIMMATLMLVQGTARASKEIDRSDLVDRVIKGPRKKDEEPEVVMTDRDEAAAEKIINSVSTVGGSSSGKLGDIKAGLKNNRMVAAFTKIKNKISDKFKSAS